MYSGRMPSSPAPASAWLSPPWNWAATWLLSSTLRDPIAAVRGINDSDSDPEPSPGGEQVEQTIDNLGQKHLSFYDLGSGLIVEPVVGPTVLSGLRVYPANDAPERDPASYVLEGSNGSHPPLDPGSAVIVVGDRSFRVDELWV